jgi:hypothetical protein
MTKTNSGIRELCSEDSRFINRLDRAWHNLLQKELNSSATKPTVPKWRDNFLNMSVTATDSDMNFIFPEKSEESSFLPLLLCFVF